ncbi:F-box-like protein [Ceratobasidium sp. AG-Ba]|nr:F-box-like protein [Ceratobasidium sp. AG-Ba]
MEVQNWRDASDILAKALQNYLDASLALESTVTHRYGSFSKWSTSDRESLFDAILAEQAATESRRSKLDRAVNCLNKLHNCSAKIVPIRALPDEILARIFALASDRCTFFASELLSNDVRKCYRSLPLVTMICSDWRRVAITTPSLWNHIDVNVCTGGKQPRSADLWLDRARSAPLYLQLSFEQRPMKVDDIELLDWLIPHLRSIVSLGLQCSQFSSWLRTALQHWVKDGLAGSVKELSVYGPGATTGADPIQYLDNAFDNLDAAQVDSFLSPIQALRLHHVLFRWASTAYQNLVHLELFHIPREFSPTSQQLADILSASPNLCVLTLHAMSVLPPASNNTATAPVKLKSLKTLNVWGILNDPHSNLFPIIQPSSNELNVSIRSNCPDRSTFNDFNVTKLFLHILPSTSGTSGLTHIPSFTNLGVMAIKIGFGIDRHTCNSVLEDLVKISQYDGFPRWPKLHTIWFFGGVYNINTMKNVAKAYDMPTLILTNVKPLYSGEPPSALRPFVKELIVENGVGESTLFEWQLRW